MQSRGICEGRATERGRQVWARTLAQVTGIPRQVGADKRVTSGTGRQRSVPSGSSALARRSHSGRSAADVITDCIGLAIWKVEANWDGGP